MSIKDLQTIPRSLITIHPIFSKLMPVDPAMVLEIAESMRQEGFWKEKPAVFWRDPKTQNNVMIDGSTRLASADIVGIFEIPCVFRDFANPEVDIPKYIFACQNRNRQTSVAVILYQLIISNLNRRGGDRKSEEREERLSTDESKRERTNWDIATALGVSEAAVKRIREEIFNNLTELQKEQVRAGELSVYHLVPAKDLVVGDIPSQANGNGDKPGKTPRRKGDDIYLQRLALTDEEIQLTKAYLAEKKIGARQFLTELVKAFLKTLDISLKNGEEGAVVGSSESSSNGESVSTTPPDKESSSEPQQPSDPPPNDQAQVLETSSGTTDEVDVATEAKTESKPVQKNWSKWSPVQDDLLWLVHCIHSDQSILQTAREYHKLEEPLLGEHSHSHNGVEHELRRLLASPERSQLTVEEAQEQLPAAMEALRQYAQER